MTLARRALLACAALLAGPSVAPAHAVPVSGYVTIAWFAPALAPTVTVGGALAAWSCVQTVWPTTGPFTVTCTPPPASGPWECDGMFAEAQTFSMTGRARTTLTCDGVVAAQTAAVSGPGGADWRPALPFLRANRALSCTVDDGGSMTAVADYVATCGGERREG